MKKKVVMVSNYINHHQIPFCNAMYERLGGSFLFIQTERMEEERIRMGWKADETLPYLELFYRKPEECRESILEACTVIFGGTDEESYIQPRLRAGRPVMRYSERLYKEAQWKAISPRGLLKKYKDHTRYRKARAYLLCAGAYVPDDFHIVRAYPGKMYRWGYFPETKHYDLGQLMAKKGYVGKEGENSVLYLLWAARFLDWKHPELPIRLAEQLKKQGIPFHLDMAGGGELAKEMRELAERLGLEKEVSLVGFRGPGEIREMMERADIFLATSDRKEGWGAVLNEAMNSGCAVVADHMMGAAPYLIEDGRNGVLYRDGDERQLLERTAELARDQALRQRLGRAAYQTITEVWNPENAADCLLRLMRELGMLEEEENGNQSSAWQTAVSKKAMLDRRTVIPGEMTRGGPCSIAPVIPERRMYGYLMEEKARRQEEK